MTNLFSHEDKSQLLNGMLFEDSKRILTHQYKSLSSTDPLEQILAVYQKSWLVEDLLMKADKATMAHSLEARTPFLDFRLVEWANSQPKAVKIRSLGYGRYETKSVLRRFCSTRLPRSVLTRPKQGFPVPAYTWLQNGLKDWARAILFDTSGKLVGFIEHSAVTDLLRRAQGGSRVAQHRLWALLILELWMREWDASLE